MGARAPRPLPWLRYWRTVSYIIVYIVCVRGEKPRRARLGGKKDGRSRSNTSQNPPSFSSSNVITLEDKILVQKYFISI